MDIIAVFDIKTDDKNYLKRIQIEGLRLRSEVWEKDYAQITIETDNLSVLRNILHNAFQPNNVTWIS